VHFADIFIDIENSVSRFLAEPNAYRSVLILIASLFIAYWLSNILAKIIIRVAQVVSYRSDTATDETAQIKLRQIETYLSVAIAAVRAIVVAVVGYIVWDTVSPISDSGAAAIGASAFFIVFAGQTLGILLRDITAGAIMIAEKWFNVGDYIRVEPFLDVGGVVEQMTLRSTKLRALNGEVVWIHNQQIAAVHMTPRGLRTLAVDIFVRDREKAEREIRRIISGIPTGKMMLARPLRIKYIEKWGDNQWRITVIGQTAPGREWLIEKHFVQALESIDDDDTPKKERLLMYTPIARYADASADRRFERAVRVKQEQTQEKL
jgi:small-conductance mechanosensitive channel